MFDVESDDTPSADQILDAVDIAIIVVSSGRTVLSCNRAAELLYGWPIGEMLGKSILEIMAAAGIPAEANTILEGLRGSGSWSGNLLAHRLDGSRVWVHVSLQTILAEDGRVLGIAIVSRDITTRGMAIHQSQLAAENGPVATYTWTLERSRQIIHLSAEIEQITGYPAERWTADPLFSLKIIHPEDRERFTEAVAKSDAAGACHSLEFRYLRPDGSTAWVRDEALLIPDALDDRKVWHGFILDITQRKHIERLRQQDEQLLESAFENSATPMRISALDGSLVRVNQAFASLLGYTHDELIRRPIFDVIHPADRMEAMRDEERLIAGRAEKVQAERQYLCRPGRVVHGLVQLTLIRDAEEKPAFIIGQVQDITERKQLEEQLRRQALHDALTGLPNRTLLLDRLSHALQRSERRGSLVAVLFLDLDNFKVINDSLGHVRGDDLIIEVTRRLKTVLRDDDTLARLGGDEFVILLEEVRHMDDAVEVSERIERVLAAPFLLGGREVRVTASLGIVANRTPHDRPDELIRDADTAMYRAKHQGKARHQVFDPTMHRENLQRLELEQDLRRALSKHELRLFYQPEYVLATSELFGVEALMRWDHPRRGLIMPGEFIAIAEETGLIIPLGEWALRTACHQAVEWLERIQVPAQFAVSVNLSARQFRQEDLVQMVVRILGETGLPARRLILEVTESTIMDDVQRAATILNELHALGIQLAIDDFGTGYSSLAHLKRFPVDFIKIDRAFVDGLGEDGDDTVLVSSMVQLGHALSLRVIAEGAKTLEQLNQLRELDVDVAQGFSLANPEPPNAITQLLRARVEVAASRVYSSC